MSQRNQGGDRHCLDAALPAVAFALLYFVLRQASLHGGDARSLILAVTDGQLRHNRHFLFLPIAVAWHWLTPFLTVHVSLQLLSACGTALGLYWSLLALRQLGFSRAAAWAGMATLGLAPSAFYFATTVEYHGLAFGGFGLAWWVWAKWWNQPSRRHALQFAMAAAIASGLHATGHMLTFSAGLWLLAGRRMPWRELILQGALAAAAYLGLTATILLLMRAPGATLMQPAATLWPMTKWWSGAPSLQVLVREWLLPWMPVSLGMAATLVAFGRRLPTATCAGWRLGLACLASWLLCLQAITLMIPGTDEVGAYFAPVAFPAAVWIMATVGRARVLLVAAALFATATSMGMPSREPIDPLFATGAAAIDAARPTFFVLGAEHELDALVVERPDLHAQLLQEWFRGLPAQGPVRAALVQALASLQSGLAAMGSRLVLSQRALDELRRSASAELQWLGTVHLPEHYELTPIDVGDFHGVEVGPRAKGR